MSGLSRGAIVLVLSALVTVGVSWKLQMDNAARLEAEIEQVEARFEDMQKQHEKAIAAGEKAARARDEIHELMNRRGHELEGILGVCPDISLLELPDGLRDFFKNACQTPGLAPSLSYGADKAPGSGEDKDSGRHGQGDR